MSHICPKCFYEGKGRKLIRGGKGMEIFLWTALMVPGPFYSLWRRVGCKRMCTYCGKSLMVPSKSDEGWVAHATLQRDIAGTWAEAPPKPVEPPRAATPVTEKKPVDPKEW